MTTDAMQILVVEDDMQLRSMLITSLASFGHLVSATGSAREARSIAAESRLDLILLDLGLPDLDGSELIPLLRQETQAPLIVISARDQEEQKVRCLDAGADDYLTKPFGMSELMARVRSLARRMQRPQKEATLADTIVIGGLEIRLREHQVWLHGEPVHLTPVEFKLLAVLARKAGRVTTHRQLLRDVWGPHAEEQNHYVRIYMRQLRNKLELDASQPRYLLTDPGVGYRLAME